MHKVPQRSTAHLVKSVYWYTRCGIAGLNAHGTAPNSSLIRGSFSATVLAMIRPPGASSSRAVRAYCARQGLCGIRAVGMGLICSRARPACSLDRRARLRQQGECWISLQARAHLPPHGLSDERWVNDEERKAARQARRQLLRLVEVVAHKRGAAAEAGLVKIKEHAVAARAAALCFVKKRETSAKCGL